MLDVLGLPLQHFDYQVLGHRALTSREFGDEALGVRVAGKGERREPQAGGPAFDPLVQRSAAVSGRRGDPAGRRTVAKPAR
ncbi:hypothetical protein ABT124_06630 [Streptomyces sp. NPDC001982]|uniref:hypothetical protein n=1 Tax=Streptomyces sp. NPDC001982 TaxID=3154405 RepID=UPI003329B079